MQDPVPEPLPLIYDLMCRKCQHRFRLRENDPITELMQCPKCGETNAYEEFLTDEAILSELYLSWCKMERVYKEAKNQTKHPEKNNPKK